MDEKKNIINTNPWIGLKSYTEDIPLYGRDEEIEALSSRILYNVQTVVYGRSGIGKSSILNAGVFPRLREQGILPVYIRFEHNDKPYINQITEAVDKALETKHYKSKEIVERHLDGDGKPLLDETLWEYFHRMIFTDENGNEITPLIVFDQFEEIFTLEKDHHKVDQFFVELADLLNRTKPTRLVELEEKIYIESGTGQDAPNEAEPMRKGKISMLLKNKNRHRTSFNYLEEDKFHVVLTIREDYLSYLERNTTHIPSLKQNRYCLQPINEEQAAQIIMQPRPGLIDKDTAKLIIEKVTGESNFKLDGIPEILVDSAVLSLYLSRLYDKKPLDEEHITSTLVRKFGDNIIEDFYNESMAEYPQEVVEFLEDNLLNNEGHRENISDYNALNSCHSLTSEMLNSMADVQKIIRKFSYNDTTRIEFIHDILCPVVKQRKEQREQLRIQEEERKKQKAERERLLKQQRRERKRFRLTIIGAVSIFIFIAMCAFSYYWYTQWEHVSYYATIEYVNGWPKGVGGELSGDARAHTPLYYKLSHRGYKNHDTDIEVLSSNPKLPKSPRLLRYELCHNESDKAGMAYNECLKAVKTVQFVEGENGKVDKEIMKDESGNVLFVISYFYLDKQNAWAQYLNSNGTAMKIRDNEIDRFKISWDSVANNTWMVSSIRYYDRDGVCLSIGNNISGFLWKYPSERLTIRYQLDELGLPTQFNAYNAISTYHRADTIDVRYFKEVSTEAELSQEADNGEGFVRCLTVGQTDYLYKKGEGTSRTKVVTQTDNRGNVIKRQAVGEMPTASPALVRYTYQSSTGYLTKEEKLDGNNHPYGQSFNDIYMKMWAYDAQGRLTHELHKSKGQQTAYEYKANYKPTIEMRETLRLFPIRSYVQQIDSIGKNRRSVSFYGEHHQMINQTKDVGQAGENDTISFHRAVYEVRDHTTTTYFYFYDASAQAETPAPTRENADLKAVSYYKRIECRDDKGNLQSMQIMDAQGQIVRSMKYIIQDGETIGRGVMGVDGDFVRCPNWEEERFCYYKIYFTKDFNKQYVGLHAYNEFGQLSAFDLGNGNYGKVEYKTYFARKGFVSEDGNNERISLMNDYKQCEFKAATLLSAQEIPYLHILSKNSDLYNAGLRDNDRLVSVGTWKLGMPLAGLSAQWEQLSTAGGRCAFEVYRYEHNALQRKVFNVYASGNHTFAEYHPMRLTIQEDAVWKHFVSHP